MSAAALVEALLMTFVLLAPTLMVAVLVSGVSRRPSPQPARVTVDPSLDGAEVVPLRTAA
jgi:hypothetical protein